MRLSQSLIIGSIIHILRLRFEPSQSSCSRTCPWILSIGSFSSFRFFQNAITRTCDMKCCAMSNLVVFCEVEYGEHSYLFHIPVHTCQTIGDLRRAIDRLLHSTVLSSVLVFLLQCEIFARPRHYFHTMLPRGDETFPEPSCHFSWLSRGIRYSIDR
jgi:hypothetical protein